MMNRPEYTAFYPPEYFSGCDIYIRFSNKKDEGPDLNVNGLTYGIVANTMPMYHYTNPTASRIWSGTRLVQGSFGVFINSSNEFVKDLYKIDSTITGRTLAGLIPEELKGTGSTEQSKAMVEKAKTAAQARDLKSKMGWGSPVNKQNEQRYRHVISSIEGSKPFNIDIIYGYQNVYYSILGEKYTVETIEGCVLDSRQIGFNHDGVPIAAAYTFKAVDSYSWLLDASDKNKYDKIKNDSKNSIGDVLIDGAIDSASTFKKYI